MPGDPALPARATLAAEVPVLLRALPWLLLPSLAFADVAPPPGDCGCRTADGLGAAPALVLAALLARRVRR